MPDIMLLGEAWGRDEEEARQPFVGASGRILNYMLRQVGIDRKECAVTNVFNLRPKPNNDVSNLCGAKGLSIPGRPPLIRGKYVLAEYGPELERLEREIANAKPNVIVALGATAAWAVLGTTGIRDIRGAPALSSSGRKVIPTYHPAAVMRDWTLRPIVISDLHKARQESLFPELERPRREIWIEPTLDDLDQFYISYIEESSVLSVDIETADGQITCIGFSPSPSVALVVPFVDPQASDGNYWRSEREEIEAWRWVRWILSLPKRVVGQNFIYDMNYLWRTYGIPVPSSSEDTMLLHHALQPEMQKGLGFLGSVYTLESSWKIARKAKTLKRED